MIGNQRGKLCRLDDAFAREQQFAVRKEMRRGVGLEGVALLDLAAADMQFGFTDFDVEKLGGGSSRIGS